jgi:hypothetical protein
MTDHDKLPIPDYDHLPLGSLTHRIRALDESGLEELLAYESAHAGRLPVREVLTTRLEALRNGSATPSAGDPRAAQPEQAPAPAGGRADTAGNEPDTNQPLRFGVAGQTPNRDIRAR